ncbi:DUF2268 domain-containing protein [Domibacillus indicus]|uniref:DUF2268 domain-containing protein n=1 Tax=Domibacillus indicus TaxID=1437523 RepID=UPI0006183493|nr:DUF2268 domain-containing putative Zn-dependent protease [Domibacillus indicus]
MPVLNSRIWLRQFIEECQKERGKDSYFLQTEALCSPLQQTLPDSSPEELHYFLLSYGLFEPEEWKGIERVVDRMEKSGLWELADKEYQRLKRRWAGPEAAVIIFPIRQALSAENKVKKNGAAFKNTIFLFVSPDLPEEEIKALLAHEYNHLCRLAFLNKEEAGLCLKDILVLEGLAEFAVKELYGETWLAPWSRLYSFEKTSKIWESVFVPSLLIKEKEACNEFLYGKGSRHFPKWIGYCIGFQIVDSFNASQGPLKANEIYQKTADELIKGSSFSC